MGIKEKILTEKDKISAMNKEQKFEYFKAYYLAKLICAFIGIILLVWFVNDTFLQKQVVSAGGIYASLDELFKDGLPEKVKDKVIYTKDPESGISYPAAIDISGTKLFKDF